MKVVCKKFTPEEIEQLKKERKIEQEKKEQDNKNSEEKSDT